MTTIYEHVAAHDAESSENATNLKEKDSATVKQIMEQEKKLLEQGFTYLLLIVMKESELLAKKLARQEHLEHNASLTLVSASADDELKLRGFLIHNLKDADISEANEKFHQEFATKLLKEQDIGVESTAVEKTCKIVVLYDLGKNEESESFHFRQQ